MVLKTLVHSILRSQRDPHNLLHVHSVKTLKQNVSHDLAEAFTLSKPLVDRYPDLYRNSTSFVDFLFQLCGADLPREPLRCTERCIEPDQADEMERLKQKLKARQREHDEEIQRFKDKLTESEEERRSQVQALQHKIGQQDTHILELEQKLCQQNIDLQRLQCNPPTEPQLCLMPPGSTEQPRYLLPPGSSEQQRCLMPPGSTEPQRSIMAPGSSGQQCMLPSNMPPQPVGLFQHPEPVIEMQTAEELKSTLKDLLVDLKQDISSRCDVNELKDLVTDVQQEIAKGASVSQQQLIKLNDLLDQSNPIDTLSNAVVEKLDMYLGRLMNNEQLDTVLEMFQFGSMFSDLKRDMKGHLAKTKPPLYTKLFDLVDKTERTVQTHTKGIIQQISRLCSSNLPYLPLLERLDALENSNMIKDTELAKGTNKLHEYCKQTFPGIGFKDKWEEDFIEIIETMRKKEKVVKTQINLLKQGLNLAQLDEQSLEYEIKQVLLKEHTHAQEMENKFKESNAQLHSFMMDMAKLNDAQTSQANPSTFMLQIQDQIQKLQETFLQSQSQLLAIEERKQDVTMSITEMGSPLAIDFPIGDASCTQCDDWHKKHDALLRKYNNLYEQCQFVIGHVDPENFAEDVNTHFKNKCTEKIGKLKQKYDLQKENYEALTQNFESQKQKHEALKLDHDALKQDHDALKQTHDALNQQCLQQKLAFDREFDRIQDLLTQSKKENEILNSKLAHQSEFKTDSQCPNTRKRIRTFADPDETDEPLSLDTMKAYFMALFTRHFQLLMNKPSCLSDASFIQEKLNILNALTEKVRPSALLEMLTIYVEFDLRTILKDPGEMGKLVQSVANSDKAVQLLNDCIDYIKEHWSDIGLTESCDLN